MRNIPEEVKVPVTPDAVLVAQQQVINRVLTSTIGVNSMATELLHVVKKSLALSESQILAVARSITNMADKLEPEDRDARADAAQLRLNFEAIARATRAFVESLQASLGTKNLVSAVRWLQDSNAAKRLDLVSNRSTDTSAAKTLKGSESLIALLDLIDIVNPALSPAHN